MKRKQDLIPMTNCSLCGKEDLSYNCPYCNGVYCSEHRLPESHGCAGLQLAKETARRRIADSFTGFQYDEDDEAEGYEASRARNPRRVRTKRFSNTEKRDLAIASALVGLVGISVMGRTPIGLINGIFQVISFVMFGLWWVPVATLTIFWMSFMIHELAHKFTAQKYGMWSEFRMTTQGYYLSAMAMLFAIPIFGTGVVYTSSSRSAEENAKTTLAGPLSNFVIAAVATALFLILYSIDGQMTYLTLVLNWILTLNAMLAGFNMIPIQPFDGATIMAWDRRVWMALIGALIVLLIFGFVIVPMLF